MSVIRTVVWTGTTTAGGAQESAVPDAGQSGKPVVGRIVDVAGDVGALDNSADITIGQAVFAGMPAKNIVVLTDVAADFRHHVQEALADTVGAVTTAPVTGDIFVNGPLTLTIAQGGATLAYRIEVTYEELISH